MDDLEEAWHDVLPSKPTSRGNPELPYTECRVGTHRFLTISLHNTEHWLNLIPTFGRGWMIQGFFNRYPRLGPIEHPHDQGIFKVYFTRQGQWEESAADAQDLASHDVEFLPHELESFLEQAIAAKTPNMLPAGRVTHRDSGVDAAHAQP